MCEYGDVRVICYVRVVWGVITGCSLSGLRARKLLGKQIFFANALFGITGFSELANSLGK